MTEREYIAATNLARAIAATDLVNRMTFDDEREESRKSILQQLSKLQDGLFAETQGMTKETQG